jgi:hypothetical protein
MGAAYAQILWDNPVENSAAKLPAPDYFGYILITSYPNFGKSNT